MNNNQICTNILLCIIFAIIIYILTRPKNNNNNESFSNNNESFSNNDSIDNNTNNTNSCSYLPPKDIKPNTIEEIIAEFDKDTNDENNNVFNFEPSTYNTYGTSIDEAYINYDVPIITPNLVNTRKNNVTNYDARDFLPKEINTEWFDTDFSQAKYNIQDDKLINTEKYVIGINTIGQSLKNPSYDIRGTIPNPKYAISPWNNSTYEPDYNLKSLC